MVPRSVHVRAVLYLDLHLALNFKQEDTTNNHGLNFPLISTYLSTDFSDFGETDQQSYSSPLLETFPRGLFSRALHYLDMQDHSNSNTRLRKKFRSSDFREFQYQQQPFSLILAITDQQSYSSSLLKTYLFIPATWTNQGNLII